jgi:hypothetical protein
MPETFLPSVCMSAYIYPPIFARERFGKTVTAAKNKLATIGELFPELPDFECVNKYSF